MLLATFLSRFSSAADSSLPVNTTTGTSRSRSSDCMRSSSSKPLMSGSRRSTTQQSNSPLERILRPSSPVPTAATSISSCWTQFDDALALDVVVFDDQQTFLVRRDVALDAIERQLEVFGRRRLHQIGERSVRETMLALFLDRQHLDRNVPRRGIELQVVQHRPAQHVGQEDVERDRGRTILLGEQEGRLAAVGHDALEALVARQSEQYPGIVRIVVHDQQDVVAFLDVLAIVRDQFLGLGHAEHRKLRLVAGSAIDHRVARSCEAHAPVPCNSSAGRA